MGSASKMVEIQTINLYYFLLVYSDDLIYFITLFILLLKGINDRDYNLNSTTTTMKYSNQAHDKNAND